HLTSAAAERRMLEAYGLNPPRRAVFEDAGFRAREPVVAALGPLLERARPRPVTPFYLMISETLQPELSAAISGIRTPEEAMRRAAAGVRLVLGKRP
ncbi:MAG TPA: ABC transporter substrate-binding protein, partial [Planctomycetota bacterium]|nr:ABC transporter substrate-binding protein [Planctomycetota bacterium]